MAEKAQTWTIQKMLQWSKQFFEDNGMDSPQLDAQLLLGRVLGMSKIDLIINAQRPLDANELAEYKKLIIRRAKAREPMAYILGEKEFWSMMLNVTSDVLIPRPDTECLVERAIEFLTARHENKPLPWPALLDRSQITYEKIDDREAYYQAVEEAEVQSESDETSLDGEVPSQIDQEDQLSTTDNTETAANLPKLKGLDIGTGSGAIALALAKETGDFCDLTASDISAKALDIARQNAEHLGLNVQFIESDLFARISEDQFDLIVSNPPYITTSEMTQLSPEVHKEPVIALEAGADGLDIYRHLIPESYKRLKPGGALMLEMGCTQQNDITELLKSAGFKQIRMFKDYAGLPRIMVGIREI
ncbi:MAG: peptide chain release factor N(5)-glutamine methyltransferase [Proteobacteria bacterium]|nr:peptide chain release factor N(5)-glutamine methyltransferase [Pseudomonadota bacterium]